MRPVSSPHCDILIFDIGDVLFSWSPKTPTNISPKTLRAITTSLVWGRFECGQLSQSECYRLVAQEYALNADDVALAFQYARDSLQPDDSFISFIHKLKADSNNNLRIFAMSNISAPDYEVLRTKTADWSVFDKVFTSAAAGMRKPTLGFYKHVINTIGGDPASMIFVDDKAENVLSARSLGMHGVVFDKTTVRATLQYLVCNPLRRGMEFLDAHAGSLESVTETGILVEENFAQLLILEATRRRNLVNVSGNPKIGKWNFFREKPTLTTSVFPFDFDTTSLALTIVDHDYGLVNAVMDEMLQFRDEDGIIQTYFDHKRQRTDPVVCVNVLSLFHAQGRANELLPTQAWVLDVLKHRAYLDGTRYYATPESFLFFLSRLLTITDDEELHETFQPVLKERLQELVGASGDSMALAMRITACATVGMRNEVDLQKLLRMQHEDGSWGPGIMYKYGSTGLGIGNRGLSTALALQAICLAEGTGSPVAP
ncbi:Haloacid dehalogenase-like hydrolase-domain-containing protein [Irpex rosettiformis]|uniref:Haloacid dehalogenase-like hydrolase-domain-containing protein n=1 Tax=Irpex rosettiformis TaxID=378272 RepID=A0ACB8TM39_9APHY|nr:Haloacid dehalogenase-like hydrolase-domain-containing protein [Irpex rosettiformis]